MTERPDRFSVIIADDEPMERERLRRLLGSDDGIEIVADCASGADTVAAVEAFAPDLLLLDIQMQSPRTADAARSGVLEAQAGPH